MNTNSIQTISEDIESHGLEVKVTHGRKASQIRVPSGQGGIWMTVRFDSGLTVTWWDGSKMVDKSFSRDDHKAGDLIWDLAIKFSKL